MRCRIFVQACSYEILSKLTILIRCHVPLVQYGLILGWSVGNLLLEFQTSPAPRDHLPYGDPTYGPKRR